MLSIIPEQYVHIPIEEIQIPKTGDTVYVNHYWITYNGCVLFTKDYGSAHCTKDELLFKLVYPDESYQLIPLAYVRKPS